MSSGQFDAYELIVWLRRYYKYNEFLYYAMLAIGIMLIVHLTFYKKSYSNKQFLNNLTYLILGFLIYVIAGHNYQHHLFYSIFFLAIFIGQLKLIFRLQVFFY